MRVPVQTLLLAAVVPAGVLLLPFSVEADEAPRECAGVAEFPAATGHVRQVRIECAKGGVVFDADVRVCRGPVESRICTDDGKGYFYVRNIHQYGDKKQLFKVTAQNAREAEPSPDTYTLEYRFLFKR